MLGTHPPRLSARSLVSLAALFGINAGTMRTALSRMVIAGDVANDGGTYVLTDRLIARQAAQDTGRRPATEPWDGTWHTALATADQRELADRRHGRVVLQHARFAELRPDIWFRPANLPAPTLDGDWLITTGPILGVAPGELVDRLWPIDDIVAAARQLDGELVEVASSLDQEDPASIPPAFALSARIVRFLRVEPLLPAALLPATWPVPSLRDRYDRFEGTLQAMMRPFLRDRR